MVSRVPMIKRTTRRTLRKLSTVDYATLDETSKKKHTATAAAFGAIAMFSEQKSVAKIESQINQESTLAIGQTLKMFS